MHLWGRKISRVFFFFTQNAIISDLESAKLLMLRSQRSVLENTICLCV